MKDAHLSIETLAKVLAGDLDYEQLIGTVIPHLLAQCPVCNRQHQEILRLQKEFAHWDERVAVFEGLQASELFATLSELPFDEQLSRVADDPSFQTWALCQLLIRESSEAIFNEPPVAINLAELAVNVSQHLGDAYDPHWVRDLRARAYAHLGNARRVLGELRSAETAFRKAEAFLTQSMTGNSQVQAELLDLKASLKREQRCYDEALDLWSQAISLYQESDEEGRSGELLVKRAKALEEAGRLEDAITELEHASTLIDRVLDEKLFFYTRHNLLSCLISASRYEDALSLLPEVQKLSQNFDEALNLVRLQWAEARISFGLGQFEVAEVAFRQVQQEFLSRRMGLDAALVSLDLAVVYAQQRRLDELKQLALEIVPVFESRDVHREAIAALVMFQQACQEERLTAELARNLAGLLQQGSRSKR